MLYYYDKSTLELRFAKKAVITIITIVLLMLTSLIVMSVYFFSENEKIKSNPNIVDLSNIEAEERIIILNNSDEFSEDKLKDYILDLNIKFPDIAFAQARYESGNWGTNKGAELFEKNNNLFGMKEATSRTTTCRGTQYGHAYYDHWRMSVLDYAMWQDAYARDIKTRDEYIAYLKRVYAEGTYQAIMQIVLEVRKKYPELYVKDYPKLER